MLVLQIVETDAEKDFIAIHKPQIFFSYDDPELMEYILHKIEQETKPDNDKWELASVDDDTSHSSELKEVTEDLEDLKITPKRKRGRPKGSKKKHVKIDENFMEIDTGINGILPDVMPC